MNSNKNSNVNKIKAKFEKKSNVSRLKAEFKQIDNPVSVLFSLIKYILWRVSVLPYVSIVLLYETLFVQY